MRAEGVSQPCTAATALTARYSFAWQEAARARSASITRAIRCSWAGCNPFSQPGERTVLGDAASTVAYALQHCSAKLCHGFACACMPMSGCMCFAAVVPADIVGFGAITDPQERSFSAPAVWASGSPWEGVARPRARSPGPRSALAARVLPS